MDSAIQVFGCSSIMNESLSAILNQVKEDFAKEKMLSSDGADWVVKVMEKVLTSLSSEIFQVIAALDSAQSKINALESMSRRSGQSPIECSQSHSSVVVNGRLSQANSVRTSNQPISSSPSISQPRLKKIYTSILRKKQLPNDFDLLKEKSKNVVVKYLPESTEENDLALVRAAAAKADFKPDLIVGVKRRGTHPTGRRPLRVFTTSESDRDALISALIKRCNDIRQGCYIRRDYSDEELALE